MRLRELIEPVLSESIAWAKRGSKVVRKFRCTMGPRKGRIVADIGQCAAAPDVAKRNRLKITKARLGARMARKAKRTKRVNPASIRTRKLNQ
jgi:hypothetical protein